MAQRTVSLTDAEVATIRRALLHVEHQAEDLNAQAQPLSVIVSRLGEAVDGIRYLLDRAERRRDVH